MTYVVNRRRRMAHRYPPNARCNTDQIEGMRVRVAEPPEGYRFCRWCFPPGGAGHGARVRGFGLGMLAGALLALTILTAWAYAPAKVPR